MICNNFPVLQNKILDLIISRCIEIDVEIVIEDTTGNVMVKQEDDEEDHDTNNQELFELDEESQRRLSKSNATVVVSEARRISADVSEQADKLDCMLILVVKFINEQFTIGSIESKTRLFYHIVAIFEERIMTTYKSKFVQFVIFFMCSMEAPSSAYFCHRLIEYFMSTKKPVLMRQSAILYLASFLARAKYIPRAFVR